MTVRELLEESRDCMMYFREKNEDLRRAKMQACNPVKRGFDEAAIALADQERELDKLAQEATQKGKRVYALIGLLDDMRQKEAMWALFAYGLPEDVAKGRSGIRSKHELDAIVEAGIQELERLVTAQ